MEESEGDTGERTLKPIKAINFLIKNQLVIPASLCKTCKGKVVVLLVINWNLTA
jgi:hypothetical protein